MRRFLDGLGFLAATLLILSGCATEEKMKPPKPPESFAGPPDDPRFSQPPVIPTKYLNQDAPRKDEPAGTDSMPKRTGGPGGGRGF